MPVTFTHHALARTDTQRALLDAIADNPDDDTLRFMYADALDEAAGGELTPRGEFIRVQCELARLPDYRNDDDAFMSVDWLGNEGYEIITNEKKLRRRERGLRARHEAEWRCPRVCERCGGGGYYYTKETFRSRSECPACHGLGRVGTLCFPPVGSPVSVTWSRGFPVIECPVAWWCAQRGVRKCPKCTNGGSVPSVLTPHGLRCSMCRGARSVPDYPNARDTWEEQGYCEVRLTDREPGESIYHRGPNNAVWYDWDVGADHAAGNLPGPIFQALRQIASPSWDVRSSRVRLPLADAMPAVNRAAQVWARGLACGR